MVWRLTYLLTGGVAGAADGFGVLLFGGVTGLFFIFTGEVAGIILVFPKTVLALKNSGINRLKATAVTMRKTDSLCMRRHYRKLIQFCQILYLSVTGVESEPTCGVNE